MDSKDRERMITVQRYKEFYVGARCEIVSVHHPVFAKNIGTIVKIVTIYDSGCVEVILWIPVRFLLIANVVIQFFKMLFKWSDGPFAAAWPFVTSFLVLATLTYIMATWKPKVS